MKKNKSDLLESLSRTHTILQGVVESPKNIVIFALDREYRYLVFNRNHKETMKQIWGVDIAVGVSMLDYIADSDDRAKARKNFDRALSGESFVIEEEYGDVSMERRYYEDFYNPIFDENSNVVGLTLFLTDITERKKIERERDLLIEELRGALEKVKVLSGLLPICSKCKKIRDDKGYWNLLEAYIEDHTDASFSHSICPGCFDELYRNEPWYREFVKKKRE